MATIPRDSAEVFLLYNGYHSTIPGVTAEVFLFHTGYHGYHFWSSC